MTGPSKPARAKGDFPKREAGALAIAAGVVLRAKGEQLGEAMALLRRELQAYNDEIMALAEIAYKARGAGN